MHHHLPRPMWLLLSCCLSLLFALPATAANTVATPQAGEFPHALLGKNLQGDVVDLEQRRGKVVIMTFWASWCGPCLHELPVLARMQSLIGKDALEVIAINWNEPRPEVVGFARRNRKLDLEYVLDPNGKTAEMYGVKAVPLMFVLDHEGRIDAVHRGYSEQALPQILEQVLALLPEHVRAGHAQRGQPVTLA
jgi:thiol-disulfide isomerase/thioredoxin